MTRTSQVQFLPRYREKPARASCVLGSSDAWALASIGHEFDLLATSVLALPARLSTCGGIRRNG